MRVIAGKWRGRRLGAPTGEGTRPTADRVKEALFSILGPLEGARVLDLYAGTGALAIEALSRGAARALLVEEARAAQRAIESNKSLLGLGPELALLSLKVERAAPAIAKQRPFDLVFADPPYAELAAAVRAIAELRGALAPGARVALEHAARDEPAIEGLTRTSLRRWGDTAISFFSPTGEADDAS